MSTVLAVPATNADTIYVAHDHAESSGGVVTLTCPTSSGLRIICGNTAAEPPTTLSTAGQVAIGAFVGGLTVRGFAYIYGVQFLGATTNSVSNMVSFADNTTAHSLVLDNCTIALRGTGATRVHIGGSAASGLNAVAVVLKDCTVKFGATTQLVSFRYGRIQVQKLQLDAAGSIPTTLFGFAVGVPSDAVVDASDLTGRAFTNLVDVSAAAPASLLVRNCKIPDSIALTTGTNPNPGGPVVRMHNCDSADTNYRLSVNSYRGDVNHETTIIRTGGASDGTTGLAWKMVSSAKAQYPSTKLESPEIMQWNSTLSSITATVEIVHDTNVAGGQGAGTGSRFQDDEIWLEVMYLGTSGFPLGTWIGDCKADVLATAADQADSSETWTTTGLTTPQKQKLSVTFTPAEIGYIVARVVMAKASKTIYVCPKMTVA